MSNSIMLIKEKQLATADVKLSKTGMEIDGSLAYTEWESLGEELTEIEGAVQWWIGDWINYGEKEYGETYTQALDETGLDYQTLRNEKWVSSEIELSRRRDNLSWSHHAEIARLETEEEQDKFFNDAEKEKWSVQNLRREISEYKNHKDIQSKQVKEITDPAIQLFEGDCRDFLPDIKDDSIDLIIIDPPYNVDKAEWDSLGSGLEYASWATDWLVECKRILKNSGSLYIFGVNRMLSYLQQVLDGMGMIYKSWIIWDTIEGAGGGLWVNRYEAILYYSKTETPYEDNLSIRLERHEENIREYKGVEYKFKNPSNIWRFIRVDDSDLKRSAHPTQKPVELIERIVQASSPQGGRVLDPFMGSGTTAIAALKNKRHFTGMEIDADYIKLTKQRIENEVNL
jgi:DNA modification methylase